MFLLAACFVGLAGSLSFYPVAFHQPAFFFSSLEGLRSHQQTNKGA
jgi:hypothetical protein